jgi:hypothetical protein
MAILHTGPLRERSRYPPADIAVDRIGELLHCDLPALLRAGEARNAR